MNQFVGGVTSHTHSLDDRLDGYDVFERLIAARVSSHDGPLFTTSADPDALWGAFIYGLPEGRRQHYVCNACRRFVMTYGGLVTIDENGNKRSLLWAGLEGIPGIFLASVAGMNSLIGAAHVTGVFYSSDETWGTPMNHDKKRIRFWSHLHGKPKNVHRNPLKTADQAMAEKREEFGMLQRGLAEFSEAAAKEALRVLQADALNRADRFIKPVEWFLRAHENRRNQNALWRMIAEAPVGFAHVKGTVVSTLYEDIQSGYDYTTVMKRWNEKMHPLQYQRPQAPPAAGNIAQAEKIVEKLGLERSFERRYATLDDVQHFLWRPGRSKTAAELAAEVNAGVFGHLTPKAPGWQTPPPGKLSLPNQRMTFARFERDVLPHAKTIEAFLPERANFYGLLTAVHPDAPTLFQWPNHVSWYVYNGGSGAYDWHLSQGYRKVMGVFLPPYDWAERGKFSHQGKRVFFALEDARDRRAASAPLCIFPECLKSELHGVRATIEAHSKSRHPSGAHVPNQANGICFDDANSVDLRINGETRITLDRMD